MRKLIVKIEQSRAGLFVATSDDVPSFSVSESSLADLQRALPPLIELMLAHLGEPGRVIAPARIHRGTQSFKVAPLEQHAAE